MPKFIIILRCPSSTVLHQRNMQLRPWSAASSAPAVGALLVILMVITTAVERGIAIFDTDVYDGLSVLDTDKYTLRSIVTNDGSVRPVLAFGTGGRTHGDGEHRYNSTLMALRAGMRSIDTAEAYGDEAVVGRVVRDSGIPRDQIFVQSKVLPKTFEQTIEACKRSLRLLGFSYLDSYLVHLPFDTKHRVDEWTALIELKKSGAVRSIGVSNFAVPHLQQLAELGLEPPSVNQIEVNPWCMQRDILAYADEHNIRIQAYAPMGKYDNWDEPALQAIVKAHGVTTAQVLLRWSVQHGILPVFGTDDPEHLRKDLDIDAFVLSADEMRALDALDRNECAFGLANVIRSVHRRS